MNYIDALSLRYYLFDSFFFFTRLSCWFGNKGSRLEELFFDCINTPLARSVAKLFGSALARRLET
jgi:hypothetical protein